jgi:hypothetical protein
MVYGFVRQRTDLCNAATNIFKSQNREVQEYRSGKQENFTSILQKYDNEFDD